MGVDHLVFIVARIRFACDFFGGIANKAGSTEIEHARMGRLGNSYLHISSMQGIFSLPLLS